MLAGAISLPVSAADGPAVGRLEITQPRTFGYHLGDKLARDILIELHDPYQLDLEALPKPGRLSHWLAFDHYDITSYRLPKLTRHKIKLVYQITNVHPDVRDIALPHHDLSYFSDSERAKLLIPATRLRVATLRLDKDVSVRGAAAPEPAAFAYRKLLLALGVLVVAIATLVYVRLGLPRSRQRQPFTEARHAIARLTKGEWNAATHEQALKHLHKAFNHAAGHAVFSETMGEFLQEHPQFARAAAAIELFFAHSRDCFFTPDDGIASSYGQGELLALATQLSDLERGLS